MNITLAYRKFHPATGFSHLTFNHSRLSNGTVIYLILSVLFSTLLISCDDEFDTSKYPIPPLFPTTDTIEVGQQKVSVPAMYLSSYSKVHVLSLTTNVASDSVIDWVDSILTMRLINADSSDRRGKERSYWFIVNVHNFSQDTMVSVSLEHPGIQTALYRKNDSVLIQEHNIYSQPSNQTQFRLILPHDRSSLFLLNIKSDQQPLIKNVVFESKPFNESMNKSLWYGTAAALLVFTFLTTCLFLLRTRDIIYAFFLFNSLFSPIVTVMNIEANIQFGFSAYFGYFGTLKSIFETLILFLYPIFIFRWKHHKRYVLYFLLVALLTTLAAVFFTSQSLAFPQKYIAPIFTSLYLGYLYLVKDTTLSEKSGAIFILLMLCAPVFDKYLLLYYDAVEKFIFVKAMIAIFLMYFALTTRYFFQASRIRKQELRNIEIKQKEISNAVITELENDRNRIAKDLHDEIGSSLALLKMKTQNLLIQLSLFEKIIEIIDKTSASLRSISQELMPPHFQLTPLHHILSDHITQLNTNAKIKFHFYQLGNATGFTKQEELMQFRIVTELLHNCMKHSSATDVTIQLIYQNKTLEIICEDNGIGFQEGSLAGLGIKSIQSRVAYMNGNFHVDSGLKGTTVILDLPYSTMV